MQGPELSSKRHPPQNTSASSSPYSAGSWKSQLPRRISFCSNRQHVAMGSLDDDVLMGNAAVVSAGAQAIVAVRLVARRDVEGVAAVAVAADGRQAIGAQLAGNPAAGSQGVLQPSESVTKHSPPWITWP